MKKILHVITSLGVGGAEMFLLRLIPHLHRHGFESNVLSLGGDQVLRDELVRIDVPISNVGMRPGRVPRPSEIMRATRMIRSAGADVLHGWMHHGNLAASLGSGLLRPRLPVAWAIHQSVFAPNVDRLANRMIVKVATALSSRPDAIVYVSERSREQHRRIGFSDERAVQIPNGISTGTFAHGSEARAAARARLRIPQDCPVVGHVARFHPMKDHANLLGAAAHVLRAHPDVHFVCIGEGVSWDNSELAALCADQHIRRRVHALGRQRDVADLLASFDLFCLSSSYGEAFPLVLLEAMSCEVPCVTTDVGDCATIVGDTGAVVEAGQPEKLGAAIANLLALPSAQLRELGEKSRRRIESRYSIETVARQYTDLYTKILERRSMTGGSRRSDVERAGSHTNELSRDA